VHSAALIAEPFEVGSFVLLTLPTDQVSVPVDTERLLELTVRDGHLERRQMQASQEAAEVRRRKDELAAFKPHGSSIAVSSTHGGRRDGIATEFSAEIRRLLPLLPAMQSRTQPGP
jgi:hypothetical protein